MSEPTEGGRFELPWLMRPLTGFAGNQTEGLW